MNYEQKYKEALERAKKELDACGSQDCDAARQIFRLFPELKESEDERIRKEIVDYLRKFIPHHDCDLVAKSKVWIAWLEKQGSQKPTIIIPKFRVGDKIVSTKNRRLTYTILEVGIINELGNPEYKVEIFTDGKAGILNKEHNIQNIEMSQMDDWGELVEHNPTEWSKEDWEHYHKLEMFLEVNEHYSKTEKSSDYQKDVHETLLWLKSLRPKHVSWSEEDEHCVELLLPIIDSSSLIPKNRKKCKNFLKSIKPNHWKPSEEQMNALDKAKNSPANYYNTRLGLQLLYNDLLKL